MNKSVTIAALAASICSAQAGGNIARGMSERQVRQVLGEPDQVINSGSEWIYTKMPASMFIPFYGAFQHAKVIDVQFNNSRRVRSFSMEE